MSLPSFSPSERQARLISVGIREDESQRRMKGKVKKKEEKEQDEHCFL